MSMKNTKKKEFDKIKYFENCLSNAIWDSRTFGGLDYSDTIEYYERMLEKATIERLGFRVIQIECLECIGHAGETF